MKKILLFLRSKGACLEGYSWSKQFDEPNVWWSSVERPDWMMWVIGNLVNSLEIRKRLVLTACKCARLMLPYIEEGELRPLKAIEAAEKWVNDEESLDNVREATDAVYRMSDISDGTAAYAAAYAAHLAFAVYVDIAAYSVAHVMDPRVKERCIEIILNDWPDVPNLIADIRLKRSKK